MIRYINNSSTSQESKIETHLGGTARHPEDVLYLHSLGLQFAEITITDPEKFLTNERQYNRLKKELGMYYLCHGPREGDPNDIKGIEAGYVPRLMQVIEIMPLLEMKILTLHLWMDPRFVQREAIEYKTGLLRRLLEFSGKSGIWLCLENLSENASDLDRIFQILPSLNLTLDLGHGQLLSNRNTSYGFIENIPLRIKHVHLHDNFGGNSAENDLHLPVGEGIIDFRSIFPLLRSLPYSHTITLELRPYEIEQCLDHVKALLYGK